MAHIVGSQQNADILGHAQGHTPATGGKGVSYFNVTFSLKGQALIYLLRCYVQVLRGLIDAETTGILRVQILQESATGSPILMSSTLSTHESHYSIGHLTLRASSTFARHYEILYRVPPLSPFISRAPLPGVTQNPSLLSYTSGSSTSKNETLYVCHCPCCCKWQRLCHPNQRSCGEHFQHREYCTRNQLSG